MNRAIADIGQAASDLEALQDAGCDTSDAGRGNKDFNAKGVGKETGVSSKDAARAGHSAREGFRAEGWD